MARKSPPIHYLNQDNPLILQSDMTIVVETLHPRFTEMRDGLLPFAELEKSPQFLHTYKLTPISVWNASSVGYTADTVVKFLMANSRYEVPPNFIKEVSNWFAKSKVFVLYDDVNNKLRLEANDAQLFSQLNEDSDLSRHFCEVDEQLGHAWLNNGRRGLVKSKLMQLGFPVHDCASFVNGSPLDIQLRETTASGNAFKLRHYQRSAVDAFYLDGRPGGGNGVLVLPCGAGKTVIGMAAMAEVGAHTLILAPNTVALRQWRREIIDKTNIPADQIGEYSGKIKEIKPITLTTYQIMTYRAAKGEDFLHFDLFSKGEWGLIIYDEVHLLPAPVFRATADIQARRRLGLTATLIREDGKEDEVFCLIGPKRFDAPWKDLEKSGFIASVECIEVRVPMDDTLSRVYMNASKRARYRLACENPAKTDVLKALLKKHAGRRILIIGLYIAQLEALSKELNIPLISGKMPNSEREELYDAFRSGEVPVLLISKVGNFAIDLPDANVAIQIAGTFGSRQEEAQRLGRILRPKSDGSTSKFYSLTSENSVDQEYAEKRQRFLTERGYYYELVNAEQILQDDQVHSDS
ncbi:MAG: DNA excision repair protein ERCC-3 [Myxococcota bacterium]|jgi:DNA excision repair protein ERCC-3